jgi:hypothetical protein
MKPTYFIILITLPFTVFSQTKIEGIIKNSRDEPVFAANVYLKSNRQNGVITDFNGKFVLKTFSTSDTLIISFIGYQTKKIPLPIIIPHKTITIVLKDDIQTIKSVLITAQDPISEKFSVVKMDMLKDVYLNPVSQGDPLKAITILPASTTTNETANPSLRGSSPERSRVILNGVPVYKPVRASQLNNQGFFSIFNPELINKQYVYASNPPLIYGNSSAGLVEIQTIKSLAENSLQISTGLASTGFLLSQNVKKDISFIQIYGNYQFSNAFMAIQKKYLPSIKNFNTLDAGINFHLKTGTNTEFNSYNYFINEQFNGYSEQFTYNGNITTGKQRVLSVNNLKFYFEKGVFLINNGVNYSNSDFNFGNIYSKQKTLQSYISINYKWFLMDNIDLQTGISHDFQSNKFKDSIPSFYYALSPNSPNYFSETSINNHILEVYLYTNWDINDKLTFSSGMRSNIPVEKQTYYFSFQLGLKYNINKKQSLLLSGGKYHNYSVPNYFLKKNNLLTSYQVALDYSYKLNNTLFATAIYYKNENGSQFVNEYINADKTNTLGFEFFIDLNFYKFFKTSFSYSFIDQKAVINEKDYHGFKDFNYLIKTTLQYFNPKIFTLSLTFISRPGMYYNQITGAVFDNQTNFYEPVFSNDLFNLQYGNYNCLNIGFSKYIRLKHNAVIIFASLNNIFNTKNENQVQYNFDYSLKHYEYYQLRSIYFGMVWQIDYSSEK